MANRRERDFTKEDICLGNKYTKKYLALLLVTEMQTKTASTRVVKRFNE